MQQQMTLEEALALASGLHRGGQYEQAESVYRQILAFDPRHARATLGLGGLAAQAGRFDDAVAIVQRAISLDPNDPGLPAALGNVYMLQNKPHEAIGAFVKALTMQPDMADVHFQVGNASIMTGQERQALVAYRQAIRIRPDFADAHSNLCQALIDCGDLDGAVGAARQALSRWPTYVMTYRHLGRAHREAGRLDDAIAAFHEGFDATGDSQLLSDMLFTLHFHPAYDRRRLFEEHRKWAERFASPHSANVQPHLNDRSPERRLRVGYVAHDLGNHPLGRFTLPILERHDRKNVEVYVYCEYRRPGPVGERLEAAADVWRPIKDLGEDALASQIREDRIDVLVDLAMHSNGSRLKVFARKPAPVQVTYLAYCGTTGVDAVDYRITDHFLDPPGPSAGLGEGPVDRDAFYAEKSARLPGCYWCYPQPEEACDVGELPAGRNGYVTFGCLNEFTKVGPAVLDLWCDVLERVAGSRLLMHAKLGAPRDRVIAHLNKEGIDPSRVEFVNHVQLHEYFALYHHIDIALDPFPWGGGTTTFDALFMGVPVVTLAGDTGVSRGGMSILTNLGSPEWVARTPQQYVEIAARLAGDLEGLARIRSGLRGRLGGSALMDPKTFVVGLEGLYREMWKRHCQGSRRA